MRQPETHGTNAPVLARLAHLTLGSALCGALLLGACTNPEVPAGHEGYIYHTPLLFGQMEYRKSLVGPASTSLSWRLFTTNIDMRERNYSEKFKLLSSDDLEISFEVNTRIRLRPGTVKDIVELWGGSSWYEWNVKERLRTLIRTEIMTIKADEIQSRTQTASENIMTALEAKFKDTPFDFVSVDIGSFKFPPEVDAAIQEKIAKQQELERQTFLLEATQKQAAIDVFQALEVSKRQRIIGQSLDPLYVQWQAVQAYRKLAESKNNTVMMLPSSTEGTGVPNILSAGRRKLVTQADEVELQEIETLYLQKAAEQAEKEKNKKEAAASGDEPKPAAVRDDTGAAGDGAAPGPDVPDDATAPTP